ncbi:DUF6503 family protein [Imperialibacter roseus]|uniref:DUF6503 family protein n=1 Tax=Imperialibacter roseus TaxID=1324217 RepID=A0ABZ0IQC1_9BACT|nr:DUF6503 family protein [Imperialibacter roseus]WOK05916.1 DUF6503 family protein [Imperialibacter roseus]
MKHSKILLLLPIAFFCCSDPSLTPASLLEKSIEVHDPNNYWPQLDNRFHMSIKRDGKAERHFSILINNPEGIFEYALQQGDSTVTQGVRHGEYYVSINGSSNFNDEIKTKFQLSEERTQYLKEVYEYLYGVPMKLKDPGTIIAPVLNEETFNGKACWVVKVTYEPSTDDETWYFYIDKETFLLAGYRFYFDESKGEGEFIFVDSYQSLNGLQLPKLKKWHWNKDSTHFRTDELLKIE